MKLNVFIFLCCLGFLPSTYADNRHFHPQADKNAKLSARSAGFFGDCQIEITNDSAQDVNVFGTFDDGSSMRPFTIYRYEGFHYIDLFYYGYCHSGMNLYIKTLDGYPTYSGYVRVDSFLRLTSGFDRNRIGVRIS